MSNDSLSGFFIPQTVVFFSSSDGWDRTPQLCCVTMIIGDPYYRTLEGFASMIESQFVLFGHQFAVRQNWFSLSSSDQSSPIFLMFIDSIFQILRQFRDAFEFTEAFLIDLCDNVDSLRFGSFLAHEKGRKNLSLERTTRSIWTSMLSEEAADDYKNPSYQPVPGRIIPCTTQRAVVFWREYFLRFSAESK